MHFKHNRHCILASSSRRRPYKSQIMWICVASVSNQASNIVSDWDCDNSHLFGEHRIMVYTSITIFSSLQTLPSGWTAVNWFDITLYTWVTSPPIWHTGQRNLRFFHRSLDTVLCCIFFYLIFSTEYLRTGTLQGIRPHHPSAVNDKQVRLERPPSISHCEDYLRKNTEP